MRQHLKKHGWAPTPITTDKFRSYHVTVRILGLTAEHIDNLLDMVAQERQKLRVIQAFPGFDAIIPVMVRPEMPPYNFLERLGTVDGDGQAVPVGTLPGFVPNMERFGEALPDHRAQHERHVPIGVTGEQPCFNKQVQQYRRSGTRQRRNKNRPIDRNFGQLGLEKSFLNIRQSHLQRIRREGKPV